MDIQLTIKNEDDNSGEPIIIYDKTALYDSNTNSHSFLCEVSYQSDSIMVRGGCDEQSIQILVMVNDEQKLMYIGQMDHKNSSFVISIATKQHLCITIV